jgi:hypothetical protein
MKQVLWPMVISAWLFGCANTPEPVSDAALPQAETSIASNTPVESLTTPTETPNPTNLPTRPIQRPP